MTASLFCLFLEQNLEKQERKKVTQGILKLGTFAWSYGTMLLANASREAPSDEENHLCEKNKILLLRLLGTLAGKDPSKERYQWFLPYLRDSSTRVARAALFAIEHAQEFPERVEEELLPLFERTNMVGTLEVAFQKKLIEALGKLGGTKSLHALLAAQDRPKDPTLISFIEKACLVLKRRLLRAEQGLGRIRSEASLENSFFGDQDLTIILRCRTGLERLLMKELAWKIPESKTRIFAPGQVEMKNIPSLQRLFQSRLFIDVLLVKKFSHQLIEAYGRKKAALDTLVEHISAHSVSRLLSHLTEGKIRYRIHPDGFHLTQLHAHQTHHEGTHSQASFVQTLAQEIDRRCPNFVNDPRKSLWQIEIDPSPSPTWVGFVPKGIIDPRFLYRKHQVPASSHKTLAAALALIAELKENDTVWDPFVGAGSELAEAFLRQPSCRLIGTDVSAKALDLTRENLQFLGVNAQLIEADATVYVPSKTSVILTNPPMGRRVQRGTMKSVLSQFLRHAVTILPKYGRLVWISPAPQTHRNQLVDLRCRLTFSQTVDMGGFEGEIQVWEKL